jgi:hypothetical protein
MVYILQVRRDGKPRVREGVVISIGVVGTSSVELHWRMYLLWQMEHE